MNQSVGETAQSNSAHYPTTTLSMALLPAGDESSDIDACVSLAESSWTTTEMKQSHESVTV